MTDRVYLLERYDDVRRYTEQLAAPLSAEDQTVQSMPDVSPTKWHRAHVTWFFETFVLASNEAGFTPFQDTYWFLFNSYYEAVGPRYARAMRGVISRPGAHDVGGYRHNVDARMRELLTRVDEDTLTKIAGTIELGFHHEQQHQELLLMDIKHALSLNPLQPTYAGGLIGGDADRLGWKEYNGGLVEVGHESASDGPFCFDNELPRHQAWLPPYRLADRLITNGEWLEFMADGGYARSELWLSDGWSRIAADGWDSPLYWALQDGVWMEHTLAGTHPIDENLPVCHISHYEADAYARWASKRLPTEAEWEHAARFEKVVAANLADDQTWHARAAGAANGSLRQLFGDCWEWTSSAYLPYPGFQPATGAIGEYNGKFMSNQMVLRGGCAFTPTGHARSSYRNFYPPSARWPLTGVRLADDG
ncbi:ergothioneine biosynthesis protein EgtB [Cumulibacter soli]|uniref:ergothioneine biosynthesis protein EgtB n=1 Tax=Cumulibacter soli TaxID=2546344 RepID=UPI001067F4B8|nr:ergothioneine biosynthesis protein EgtB [Cumulibacter soli]